MKTASESLITLLNGGGPYLYCELYTFTLADGSVLRTTDADIAITWGGNTFPPGAPLLKRSRLRVVIGTEADSLTLTAWPKASDTAAGLPFAAAARQGAFDGATLRIDRAYLSSWPVVVGTLNKFVGLVSDIAPSRNEVVFTVKSALELLAVQMPRNVYQGVCMRSLYDTGCGVSRSAFTVSGTASGAGTRNTAPSGRTEADGWFDQGVLTFTSGALAGVRRTIQHYAGGTFTFALPLPSAPVGGETFTAYPGCDKTAATCASKFANLRHFRAFPYIPVPETTFG